MPSGQLMVFGSIVQDLVSYVDRFPKPGESVRGNEFKASFGGKGANQAVMAAKLGASVKMVGMVGNDMFADPNINSIKSSGVDTSLIRKSATSSTGVGVIHVNEEGENCIVVTLGANLEMTAASAVDIEADISRSILVMCQSEIHQAANLEAFKIAKKHGVSTFFNPAPGRPDLDRSILPLTDVICTNENEAEFMTGRSLSTLDEVSNRPDADHFIHFIRHITPDHLLYRIFPFKFKDAAKQMTEMGPRLSIVTMGPKGAIIAQRTQKNGVTIDIVDCPKVKALDTTVLNNDYFTSVIDGVVILGVPFQGAGDCFCGSLAYFLTSEPEGNAVEMVRKATKIAAISVQRHGAQQSYPSREELEEMKIV